jgi:hypothetical protein
LSSSRRSTRVIDDGGIAVRFPAPRRSVAHPSATRRIAIPSRDDPMIQAVCAAPHPSAPFR